MKRQRPAAGWPWERPGYSFFMAEMQRWLNGYVPTVADAMLAGRSTVRDSANSVASREKQMATGTGWASGSIGALSSKPNPALHRPVQSMQPARKVRTA